MYRDGAVLAVAAGNGYGDLTASPATTYSYTVDAVDGYGNHSAPSAAAVVSSFGAESKTRASPSAASTRPTTFVRNSVKSGRCGSAHVACWSGTAPALRSSRHTATRCRLNQTNG